MGNDLILFSVYLLVLFLLAWPVGRYMAKVFNQEKTIFDPIFHPIEKGIYRMLGIDPSSEMNWKQYATAVILFNVLGTLLVFAIQMLQDVLPFNPEDLPVVPTWHLALNTAISFMTNTNWQAYAGETTMSYFTQMVALTVQNFLSAATGLAVAIALVRGLARKMTSQIGNFWVDLVRSVIYVLLPLSIVFAVILVQQGVPQTLSPYVHAQTVEGAEQVIALGPVASQEAIKMLGTNGGGFFNANSAHPFENPTPLTNFLEILAIFLVPVSSVYAFGFMVKDRRQGYAILGTMALLFVMMLALNYSSEVIGNPLLASGAISGPTAMEGKEVRFGIGGSSLFAVVTTAASCGGVNSMHDSFTPLGGLVPMLQIMMGEVVIGGVGAGLYGMLAYVVLAVFIVGLMVGRTPEYLGKKIEAWEMKMATIAILIPAVTILIGSAITVVADAGLEGIANPGPHGLSEVLYAFASCTGNNGSAFGGLTVNTLFYDCALSIVLLLGRFGVIIPMLAIAGSMAEKKIAPPGQGTFPTTGWLFVLLLACVVLIISALTFLPALALGPVLEHLLMLQGTTF
nr:potassium-transporting ATPase subunit KdpA [uncultured Anaeromusa sp.]